MFKKIIFFFFVCFSMQGNAHPFEYKPSEIKVEFGRIAVNRFESVNQIIKIYDNSPELIKLEQVNSFLNMFKYVSDSKLWGVEDLWTKPEEFIALGGGDCEDFAIAKREILVKMHIPESKFKFLYVDYLPMKNDYSSHLVLAYYPNKHTKDPLILDNLDGDITPLSLRKDLSLLSSFQIIKNKIFHGSEYSNALFNEMKNAKNFRMPYFIPIS